MSTAYVGLPSEKAMKGYCRTGPNQLLVQQTSSLLIVLSVSLCIFFSIPTVLGGCYSYLTGAGFWAGNGDGLSDWLQKTVIYSLACASTTVALLASVRLYMRSQYGPPSYAFEMEAELPRKAALELCQIYMRGHAEEEMVRVEEARSRIIAVLSETELAITFVEVRALPIDEQNTRILVRAASVPYGKASLVSAYYNDLGTAKESAMRMKKVFRSYTIKQKRTAEQWTKQLEPVIRTPQYYPPPTLRARQSQLVHLPPVSVQAYK